MSDLAALTELCKSMGANASQAEIMAKQLIKRSLQLAEERHITQVQAMDYLLKLMVHGQSGEVVKEYTP